MCVCVCVGVGGWVCVCASECMCVQVRMHAHVVEAALAVFALQTLLVSFTSNRLANSLLTWN